MTRRPWNDGAVRFSFPELFEPLYFVPFREPGPLTPERAAALPGPAYSGIIVRYSEALYHWDRVEDRVRSMLEKISGGSHGND